MRLYLNVDDRRFMKEQLNWFCFKYYIFIILSKYNNVILDIAQMMIWMFSLLILKGFSPKG